MKQIKPAVKARLKLTAGWLAQCAIVMTLVLVGDRDARWTVALAVGVCALAVGATTYLWGRYWFEQRASRADDLEGWPEQGL